MRLKKRSIIFGFGHGVFKGDRKDNRVTLVADLTNTMRKTANLNQQQLEFNQLLDKVEKVMLEKKQLYSNMDFYALQINNTLGIPVDLTTLISISFKTAAIAAHIIEQKNTPTRNIFVHSAKYVGPVGLKYVDIKERASMIAKF